MCKALRSKVRRLISLTGNKRAEVKQVDGQDRLYYLSSLTYLLGQLLVLYEPFCPVDTVLLFTVFTVLYLCC